MGSFKIIHPWIETTVSEVLFKQGGVKDCLLSRVMLCQHQSGAWLTRQTLTFPMLRPISSKAHGCKDFWKTSKLCHAGIHWKALTEYSQMSTHMPGFQSFSFFFASCCIGQNSHQQRIIVNSILDPDDSFWGSRKGSETDCLLSGDALSASEWRLTSRQTLQWNEDNLLQDDEDQCQSSSAGPSVLWRHWYTEVLQIEP